jgi:hypothetical protein
MADTNPTCIVCQSKKVTTATCGLCQGALCKTHKVSLGATAFLLLEKIPAPLAHAHYCASCYDTQVAPALATYDEMAEKANDIYFITKNYTGYVHVQRRHTKRVLVKDCADRRETILRMAFQAAELGMNALIESEVESFNTRKDGKPGGYQSARWKGSAMPAQINGEQLERASLRRI